MLKQRKLFFSGMLGAPLVFALALAACSNPAGSSGGGGGVYTPTTPVPQVLTYASQDGEAMYSLKIIEDLNNPNRAFTAVIGDKYELTITYFDTSIPPKKSSGTITSGGGVSITLSNNGASITVALSGASGGSITSFSAPIKIDNNGGNVIPGTLAPASQTGKVTIEGLSVYNGKEAVIFLLESDTPAAFINALNNATWLGGGGTATIDYQPPTARKQLGTPSAHGMWFL